MAAWHWLRQKKGRVQGILHVNHGTGTFADDAEDFVREQAKILGTPFHSWSIDFEPPFNQSWEDFWRDQRLGWFKNMSRQLGDLPVVLAHNLDDCVEEYIICAIVRGYSGTIPYQHGPCIRPFRCWSRAGILEYGEKNRVPFRDDPSNKDLRFLRNHVRHLIVPRTLDINPGLHKIVERVMRTQDARS